MERNYILLQPDYKALYEELKAKMDKIEWAETKAKIDKELDLTDGMTNLYVKDQIRADVKAKNHFKALNHFGEAVVEDLIKTYGYEALTKVLDETLADIEKEEAKKEEEEK